jgi:hypothetical protein
MADTKVTGLPSLTTPAGEDLLYIIDNPSGTPASKSIDLLTLFGNVSWNVSVNGTFTIANTGFRFGAQYTPANSTITVTQGTVFYDANYLYVATANNNLKRIELTVF